MIHRQIEGPKEVSKDVQNPSVNTGTCLPECQGVFIRGAYDFKEQASTAYFSIPFP